MRSSAVLQNTPSTQHYTEQTKAETPEPAGSSQPKFQQFEGLSSRPRPAIGKAPRQTSKPNMQGRLVVVSNRMIDPKKPAAGGVAVALEETMRDNEDLWLGWSGKVGGRLGTQEVKTESFGKSKLAGIDLTRKQFDNYYSGFCNSALWPVMHNSAQWADFNPEFYGSYRQVNKMFASKLAPMLKQDDVLWIHDYHLIPLAEELRKLGCKQRIGFFNHTPFPTPDVFKEIPQHKELMKAFFAYDLVGMQIPRDVQNFRDYVANEKVGKNIDDRSIEAFGQKTNVQHFPIGIDIPSLEALQAGEDSAELVNHLKKERKQGRTLMIGVERLDYAKGIPDRLAALGDMLEKRSDLRNKVTFVQIAAPSRQNVPAYAKLARDTRTLVDNINRRYGTKSWSPIMYIDHSVNRNALPEIYRMSRVGVITSKADGMNLVSKEYVAAQDPKNPGVLVLSEGAGSAYQLKEALQIPPEDRAAITGAYETALGMRLGERRKRHGPLLENVQTKDLGKWRSDCLAPLCADPSASTGSAGDHPVPAPQSKRRRTS
ncbi:trehalose-6-phosphate synthase [Xanthomonas translucens pv. undulosa]|nr:trehalose-6-phosphate synthase [Xanthomonas translucens pv. undulosa]QSQ58697.1 trehalose-6-phosphate synthase [Xanthomonas translucens pv. undulosa]